MVVNVSPTECTIVVHTLMKIKLKKCYESLNSQRESIRFLKNHFLIEISTYFSMTF